MLSRLIKYLTVVLIIGFFQTSYAQSTEINQLTGQVTDKTTADTLFDVEVLVLNKASSIVTGAHTNEEGVYVISNIPTGTYLVKAVYFGYENWIQQIVVNQAVQQLNIQLK